MGAAVEAPLVRHASGGFETYLDKHTSHTVLPGLFFFLGTGAAADDGTVTADPASPRHGPGSRGTAHRRGRRLQGPELPRRDFYRSVKEALRAGPSGAASRPSCAWKVPAAWRWRR